MVKERLTREIMAMRVALMFQEGDVVNLGAGMPTLISNFLPQDRVILVHSENGLIGVGAFPEEDQKDFQLVNAGGQLVTLIPGAAMVHHADSFGVIRGGHLDYTVLGGMQVSPQGDLANWMIPERGIGSIGGAADLAVGAKHCVVMMEHTTKDDEPKVVNECSYPLTGQRCVEWAMTDLALIRVTPEGLVLEETAPGWTPEEIQELTEPRLIVSKDLKEVAL